MNMKRTVMVAMIAATFAANAETLRSDKLAIEFAGAERGYAIESVENLLTGTKYAEAAGKGQFWELSFGGTVKLTSAAKCRDHAMTKNCDGGATFVWEGMDLPDKDGAVTVKATVKFDAEGKSEWTMTVENTSAVYALYETRFPIITHTSASGEADVLMPRQDTGAFIEEKRAWGMARTFGCMGYMPMMIAFMKAGGGIYFAAHDSTAAIKNLKISKEHDLSFTTPVENAGIVGEAAEGPRYAVTLAAFKGDWWQAAKFYRAWALTTPWTAKGPIISRADYPKRMAEIPLWLNIHGLPNEVSNVMTRAKSIFPKYTLGIHWHVWQHSIHDVNYPEYFPEQVGAGDCFKYCTSIGTEAMPYTNGRLWSVNLMSYPYVVPYTMKRENGTAYVEKYGPTTAPFSPMCPYTEQWYNTLNDFAGRILALGAKSLFLDQIGACSGQPCYDPHHGHPVGGGTWFFEGYQRILAKTHAAYSAKDAILTTEGSGEEWMNVIDGYLNVTQRRATDVPFFHAVYNGYTTYFCSPENQEDDMTSFRAAQMRETLWGQSLGWYHPLILDYADKCELLNRLAAFRQAHLGCLAYGTLEGEVKFLDKVPQLKFTWLGRKPFWAWKLPGYPLSKPTTGEMQGVIGYEWKNGIDGTREAYLANLTEKPYTARFVYDGGKRSMELKPGEIVVVK